MRIIFCYLGLDNQSGFIRINPISLMEPVCQHNRTEVIARRAGVDYMECVDCRLIFEAEDLEPVTVEDDEE